MSGQETAQEILSAHLMDLWKANIYFHRYVEMDKLYRLKKGEEVYCTRIYGAQGELQEEPISGSPCKDYISEPGMLVKFTQHHTAAYPFTRFLWDRVLPSAGYMPTWKHKAQLRLTGKTYLSNGMDNRMPWGMTVDDKLASLLRDAEYQKCDILHGDKYPVSVGDFLCVKDEETFAFHPNGAVETGFKISVSDIRSAAYAKERMRPLSTL